MTPIPCWGKPGLRPCGHDATRFFVSLAEASPGFIPKNRAVCATCFERYRFDHFVRVGVLREVTRTEWEPLTWTS